LVHKLKSAEASEVKSGWANGNLAEVAKSLYSRRRSVDIVFGHDGFATSPGWDVMLDLYQAEAIGKQISVTSACIGAACPPTTALRWIQALESMGLIARISDPSDKRRTFVQLTPLGRSATEEALHLYRAV
jgi:predicted transcriptional regulator